MPDPPGFLNKFQFIKYFALNTCHHPFTLYVEFAFPPAVEASHSLLMLDLPQIARSLFRPKGIRTKRHGRKAPKKRGGLSKGVPDWNDLVAIEVKETFDVGERVVTDGVKQLWTFLDKFESILGKLFIVEVVEEWLYKWALLIDANDRAPCEGYAAVRAEGGGTFASHHGVATVGGADAVWSTGGAGCFNGTVFMPVGEWFVTLTATVTNLGSGTGGTDPVTAIVGIMGDDGHFLHGVSRVVQLSYLQSQDVIVTAFFHQGEQNSCVFVVFIPDETTSQIHLHDGIIFAQTL